MTESAITDSGAQDPRHERAGRNPFKRIALFVRQVVSELRLVVTPTFEETRRYVFIVLVFVAVVMAMVTLLDLAFGWGAGQLFGE